MNGPRVGWIHSKYVLFGIGFIYASVMIAAGMVVLLAITTAGATGITIGVIVAFLIGLMVCPFIVWKCLAGRRRDEASPNTLPVAVDGDGLTVAPTETHPTTTHPITINLREEEPAEEEEDKPPPYIDPPSYDESQA